jgi:MFS family permease
LRIRLFRALWIAALVSNVGTWMQTVGAQWLVVHDAHAALLVALVQTAYTLPAVLFALVGGVLADIFNRVKLLVAVLAGMTVAGAALTALTAAHRMPPALLLMFTFVLGTGAILVTPAYQSLVPDMVPRPQVASAAALNSISINLARAIGPAIAGLLVAQIGVAAVFALNTATLLLYAIVVAFHPRLGGTPESPERFIPGLRAGGRYVRNAPVVQRILLRAALFLVPGSALWALLPLIATRRLALGSEGYGVLLGALGVGAIGGAFILPQIRARLSANALVAVASVVYAAVLAVVVLSRSVALTVLVLLPAGVAWIAFLANVNAALQLFLPKWVRARGLSVYQMVLFGGQAAGALIWGVAAGVAGLVPAFLISAAVMAAGAATIWFWPFYKIENMDRSLVRWPEPQLRITPDDGDGLVLVRTTYTIAAGKEQQFLRAMADLRRSRLRTGATDWGLYRDGQNPRLFIELFSVASWEEHLRQHQERQTGTDLEYHDAAAALSDPQPQTGHYLAAALHE